MNDFHQHHWALIDLHYTYLDDGYRIQAITDTPCHLFCRMTTTPPLKHALPSRRRGTYLMGDIRFCFVVYEDNEQQEPGDTYVHTFIKDNWPICETRWFYFIGTIAGNSSVSESPIFKFHFPAPPPEPPPPIEAVFICQANNRTIQSNHVAWPICWAGANLFVGPWHGAPLFRLVSGASLTATFWAWEGFLTFDTSTLPDTAIKVSAQLALYYELKMKTSSIANPYLQLTKGHQSDPVVAGDWGAQRTETLVLGQIHLDNIILNQYNDLDLNQSGLDHINLAGVTKYCFRGEQDVLNIPPALGTNQAAFHSVQKGPAFWPALKVQYYPA